MKNLLVVQALKMFQSKMKSKGDSRDMLAMAQRLLDDIESEKKVDNSKEIGMNKTLEKRR
jgi:hypothetical protein